MHGVAHLCADQGFVTEVVVAGDKRVPLLALGRAPEHGSQADRAHLIEGLGRRFQRRVGIGSEGHWHGGVAPPLRRWQDDQPVLVHGQHGDARHHVLEPAVGLVPADAPAERFRQGEAVQGGRPGDECAQQRHFLGREVAPVVAALDRLAHVGAIRARQRVWLIDQGNHSAKSGGARPPLAAQALSHSCSQRCTSMSFSANVSTTEYISAVSCAPVSLSEPNDRRRPMTAQRSVRSAKLSRKLDYSGIVPGTGLSRAIECKNPE